MRQSVTVSKTSVVSTDAIAGKPAPTGFSVNTKLVSTNKHCGNWLASDSGFTGEEN
jgi:hypothetical protein